MEQEYSTEELQEMLAYRQNRTLGNVKNLGMANLFYKEVLPEATPSAACYQEQPTPAEAHNCGMDYYTNYAANALGNMPKPMPNQQGGGCGCTGKPQPKENKGNCGCTMSPQPKEHCGDTEQPQPKQSCGYSVHNQPKPSCDHSAQPQPKPHCGYTEQAQPKQGCGCTDIETTTLKCPCQMPHACGADYGQQLDRMEQMLREMYMTNQELFKSILNYCKTYTIK